MAFLTIVRTARGQQLAPFYRGCGEVQTRLVVLLTGVHEKVLDNEDQPAHRDFDL
ncbi:MAG: hypothetical protein JWM26_283 [Betaproteobacteria bacterium]|nr:hypothetical protein [Betaproteobacteria bacterium]